MKLKIGVVGFGYVGKQLYNMFKNYGYEVFVYDPAFSESNTKEDINSCDLACIAVPTNPNPDGSCDISIVEESVSWLKTPLILIKSAIVPGTTDHLKSKYSKRIVVSPEYCGESKYDSNFNYFHFDMKKTPWIVIGGDNRDLDEIYDILLPVVGPEKIWHFLTAREAELVKYFENTFFACKVAIINEMYDICSSLGADWKKVREAWLADPRLSRMHTAVFNHNRGFGGKCYPKDTAALLKLCNEKGFDPVILRAVIDSNKKLRSES